MSDVRWFAAASMRCTTTPTRSPSVTDSVGIGAATADQQHGRFAREIDI